MTAREQTAELLCEGFALLQKYGLYKAPRDAHTAVAGRVLDKLADDPGAPAIAAAFQALDEAKRLVSFRGALQPTRIILGDYFTGLAVQLVLPLRSPQLVDEICRRLQEMGRAAGGPLRGRGNALGEHIDALCQAYLDDKSAGRLKPVESGQALPAATKPRVPRGVLTAPRPYPLVQALAGQLPADASGAASTALAAMEAGFETRFGGAEIGKGTPDVTTRSMDAWIYYALMGGGKRLRPLLLHACAGFGKTPADPALAARLMQAIELIHAASLVHDDIIDHSALRHGRPTINAEKGDAFAARCGFAMVAEALQLLRDVDDYDLLALFAGIPMDMCMGELLQIDIEGRPALQNPEEYYARIEKKTAALIEGSCRAGGMLCRGDTATLDALSRYAHALGILFQLRDDLLDYDAQPGDGKPVAQDIERGVYSLPLLHALQTLDENTSPGAHLRQVMAKPQRTAADVAYLLNAARTSGGIARTQQAMADEAVAAAQALDALPQCPSRDILSGLLSLFAAEDPAAVLPAYLTSPQTNQAKKVV